MNRSGLRTPRTGVWCLLLVCGAIIPVLACQSRGPTPALTAPSAVTSSPAVSTTLSGEVFDVTPGGRVPAPNIPLVLVVVTSSSCRAPCTSTTRFTYQNTTTGPDGRYHFPELPAGSAVVAIDSPSHRQICGAGTDLRVGARLDVEITSRSNPQPSPTMPPLRVSGQVYEMTPAGRVGVSDAWIGVDHHANDSPFFTVFTDAGGRYSMCGIPANWPIAFDAGKSGYDGSRVWHHFGAETTVDIELLRLHD